MGFWNSLFGGQNSDLNTDIGATGKIAANLTGQGQSFTNQAGNFWSSILSGDSSKVTQALSPQISAEKTSAQQNNKTAAEFGTRSGGTAASTAATTDKTHANITNLIGNLTGSSASNLASLGSNEISQGLGAYSQNAQFSQDRIQNWTNSILGLGVTKAAGYAEGMALGPIPGGGGGG